MGGKVGRPRIISVFREKEKEEHKSIKRLKKCLKKIMDSLL